MRTSQAISAPFATFLTASGFKPTMDASSPILPTHIQETIRSIARLHAEHHQAASSIQRTVERMTALAGRPRFIGVLTALVLLWVGGNLLALWMGRQAIDPPPFPWLESVVSLAALYIALLILTTQRRADQLAQHREQLTLELAILSEQKTAKVIELLEEMRRDHPSLKNREDHEAAAMAVPADPETVLEAIKAHHADAELLGGGSEDSLPRD
jgi:uncharacterized membrane protein